jgi:creatinine amidohydrolase
MPEKTQWRLMTWRQVRDASNEKRVVLIPAGTCETQGNHTAVGFEHILPERLADAVAQRTNAVAVPVIPFGWSADFEDYPGTISIRPETLACLYEDVFRAVLSHGFDHILVLATHLPNQPMIEQAAYRLRREFCIRIAWFNPGQLANRILQQVSPDPARAQGHGADPGISLGEYLEPGSTDFSDMKPNRTVAEFEGFPMSGMAPNFEDFPISFPLMLQDVSPQSSGSGDPTVGDAKQGEQIFELLVDYTTRLVEQFAKGNTHVGQDAER